jgi:DNA repair ATPase RecN
VSRLSEISVQRFQSLYDVTVPLGKLTVVVGHSNSGKSAFGRALRAISRNNVSPGYVTKGSSTAKLRAAFEDGSAVTLERGKGTSTYTLTDEHGHEELYAKCGTSVPDDVAKVLRTPEGDPDVFFSTQFDAPWLLDVTGTQAAKVLGDLTNVSVLADAAREANRRRQECTKLAGIRRKDAENALARIEKEYSDLGQRKQAVERARELLASVIDQGKRAEQLQELADRVLTAEQVIERSGTQISRLESLLSQVAEEMAELQEIENKINAVEALAHEVIEKATTIDTGLDMIERMTKQAQEAEEQLHEALKEEGVCPLCQQKIS